MPYYASHSEGVRGNSRTSKAPINEIEAVIKAWLKNAPRRCSDDKSAADVGKPHASASKRPATESLLEESSESDNGEPAVVIDQIGQLINACSKRVSDSTSANTSEGM